VIFIIESNNGRVVSTSFPLPRQICCMLHLHYALVKSQKGEKKANATGKPDGGGNKSASINSI